MERVADEAVRDLRGLGGTRPKVWGVGKGQRFEGLPHVPTILQEDLESYTSCRLCLVDFSRALHMRKGLLIRRFGLNGKSRSAFWLCGERCTP